MTMTIESSEHQADQYLREHGLFARGTGCYTEAYLERKAHRQEQFADDLEAIVEEDSSEPPDTLIASDWIALGHAARLTDAQQDAWEWRIRGLTHQEIADILGVTRRAVSYRLEGACRKMLSCPDMLQYFGLWDVYAELVHRICKARPCTRNVSGRKFEEIAATYFPKHSSRVLCK